jgi:hypothetical protein
MRQPHGIGSVLSFSIDRREAIEKLNRESFPVAEAHFVIPAMGVFSLVGISDVLSKGPLSLLDVVDPSQLAQTCDGKPMRAGRQPLLLKGSSSGRTDGRVLFPGKAEMEGSQHA